MGLLDDTKAKMEAAIEHLKNELKNIRTGRANPAMVDHILIDVYGSNMRIKDLSTISAPEPRMLLITPFDPSLTATIGKKLEKENLGFTVVVEANCIRIKIPPMTEEIRKKMAKVCGEEKEKCKIRVRDIRRHANEDARKQKADGIIAEDQMKKWEKSIQEFTDKYCKEAEEAADKKEKEVLTI